MGNRQYSFESLNPERYEEVRLSSLGLCADCNTFKFPFDRKPPSLKDDIILWNEFGKEINELLPLLNKYLLLVLFIAPFLFVTSAWLTTKIAPVSLSNNDPIFGAYLMGGFFVVAIIYFLAVGAIFNRNEQVDNKIKEVCSNYTRRFQEHGVIPEYRTRWTNLCKPKGARPLRMIVFIPAGNDKV